MIVREHLPLALTVDIATPNGQHHRWASDEHAPENVPSGLSFSSTIPGGFEHLDCTLPRNPGNDYADLAEFSTLTVMGVDGRVAWQGRLETTPRTSGDQMSITPGAVGWQASLDDDKSARMIYVDRDFSHWGPEHSEQKLTDQNAGFDVEEPQVGSADYTTPALLTSLTGPWDRSHTCKAWYDAKSIPIDSLYFAWKKSSNVGTGNPPWEWNTRFSSDDQQTSTDSSGPLNAAGPGSGTLTASDVNRRFSWVELFYSGANTVQETYVLSWTCLAVYGRHGLTKRGTEGATTAKGFYASDIIGHAVNTWAPRLVTSRAGMSTIEPTTFVIPNATYLEPTSAAAIIADVLKYELLDWWVDEGPTFNLASRGNHGRKWRARVGPSGLQETGPQVDRLYNAVVVPWNDVANTSMTVGSTGSGAMNVDDSLADADPENPVTAAGLTRRYLMPNIGVSTLAGATKIGQAFLAEQKRLSTAGQATITGLVQDEMGLWWPAWMIRAGDQIMFTDAHDPVYRHVAKVSYSDSSRSCQLDLDSPPESLDALLARYGAALTGIV